ncbi:hypothetical protein OJAV_G00060540 [Oryzias javanicus]|uniref:Uncharacterized protein n=1 Tax=Oryzias javanicus TaxID=123683 RepID=A0A3S2MC24_ORYJA|nr:hypothetical protein OJAV_G00060540 [Oryzias javanicus]
MQQPRLSGGISFHEFLSVMGFVVGVDTLLAVIPEQLERSVCTRLQPGPLGAFLQLSEHQVQQQHPCKRRSTARGTASSPAQLTIILRERRPTTRRAATSKPGKPFLHRTPFWEDARGRKTAAERGGLTAVFGGTPDVTQKDAVWGSSLLSPHQRGRGSLHGRHSDPGGSPTLLLLLLVVD